VTRLRQGYGVASELMNRETLTEFAKRYTQAWCSHDPEAVVAFYAENASISVNDAAPAPIAEVTRSFMGDFPDMIVTFDKLEPHGDRVAFYWTLIGTHSETGNRVRISGYESWKIDNDGLIVESQGHFDAAEYQRQLKSGV
jgi:predicted ester cyclase